LYERAATATDALAPLWHIDDGCAIFAGPLHYNAAHAHSIPVYIAGIYGAFGLRISGDKWRSACAAVIPAGKSYELEVGGDPLAVFYLEPSIAGVDALAPLIRNVCEVQGALIGTSSEKLLFREFYEDRSSAKWAGLALNSLLDFSQRSAAKILDPRIAHVVETMHSHCNDLTPVAKIASSVGLSASRFQHVFTQEVGVPYRRYRSWHRLRAAIREVVAGSDFTTAAHATGFCDQAHFAHDFRRTFGAPASRSLFKVRD
jgi:AraC-like DNA-binding protein